MPTDAEITFADHMGRFYARRYAFPPMVGRLLGYLAVCDPPEQSIGELADALLASRSAIAGAVKVLESMHAVSRMRTAGERMDRVRIDLSSPRSMGLDISEYEEMSELAREGLEVLRGRSGTTAGGAAGDGGVRRLPAGADPGSSRRGRTRRAELVASGELPDPPPIGRAIMSGARGGDRRSGCASPSARRWCSTGSTSPSPRARSSPCSARTVPARPRWCGSSRR